MQAQLVAYAAVRDTKGKDCPEAIRLRNAIIMNNTRLVFAIARKTRTVGLDAEDARAYGMLGLIEGIERFDPSRGFAVATYVGWWVRHAISRSASNYGQVVRVPVHVQDAKSKAKPALIAAAAAARTVTSLDVLLSAEAGSTTHLDMLASEVPDAFEQYAQAEEQAQVDAAMAKLPERERAVLLARLEDHDGKPATFASVGNLCGRSRERIRQIEADGHARLRRAVAA
ncbi:MAG: sigma70-ECF: polymerase sigma factor, sigma-70 family [Myxococcaceae bacterium]|nr:sigma70-ECF: polymerase sigma factor, sigma-70 family [Myxococcaceae bacterium]